MKNIILIIIFIFTISCIYEKKSISTQKYFAPIDTLYSSLCFLNAEQLFVKKVDKKHFKKLNSIPVDLLGLNSLIDCFETNDSIFIKGKVWGPAIENGFFTPVDNVRIYLCLEKNHNILKIVKVLSVTSTDGEFKFAISKQDYLIVLYHPDYDMNHGYGFTY